MISYIRDSSKNWVVTFEIDGSYKTLTFDGSHPQHDKLVELLGRFHQPFFQNQKDKVLREFIKLHNVGTAIDNWSNGHFKVSGEVITYKNNPVEKCISERIIEMITDGFDYQPMLNFIENIYSNPSCRSVNELYKFLEHKGLPITDDGCFLAYKAVGVHSETEIITDKNGLTISVGDFVDLHTLCSYRNNVGDCPSMERCLVTDDFRVHCGAGLHVSTLAYAKSFRNAQSFRTGGDAIVIVKVNPADVVSVPEDYDCQKVRCCKYEVLSIFEK